MKRWLVSKGLMFKIWTEKVFIRAFRDIEPPHFINLFKFSGDDFWEVTIANSLIKLKRTMIENRLTAACAVMCVHPTIRAPSNGFSLWFRLRNRTMPGISEKKRRKNYSTWECCWQYAAQMRSNKDEMHTSALPPKTPDVKIVDHWSSLNFYIHAKDTVWRESTKKQPGLDN